MAGAPSGYYQPEPIASATSTEELVAYVLRELRAVSAAMELARAGRIDKSYVAPTKTEEGLVVLADGVSWNPGAGAGVYCYYGGAWNRLG